MLCIFFKVNPDALKLIQYPDKDDITDNEPIAFVCVADRITPLAEAFYWQVNGINITKGVSERKRKNRDRTWRQSVSMDYKFNHADGIHQQVKCILKPVYGDTRYEHVNLTVYCE